MRYGVRTDGPERGRIIDEEQTTVRTSRDRSVSRRSEVPNCRHNAQRAPVGPARDAVPERVMYSPPRLALVRTDRHDKAQSVIPSRWGNGA